jgi:DNA polymerase-3 subunit gamma/tau
VTTNDVHRLLGTAPDERLVTLAEALIVADAPQALSALEEAFAAGVQVGSLSDQLLEYLRDLLIAGLGAQGVPLLSVAERLRPELEQQAQRWGSQTISAAMQILVETKSRMQRVTYGRALLELAIVRVCLLEKLDDVAGLIRNLREMPAATGVTPDRPAARPLPAARPIAPPAEAEARKKNELSEPIESVQAGPENGQAASSNAPIATAEIVDLSDETLQGFWAKVVASLPEVIANHLRNASRVAISGPNGLEILFPARYSFSRSYCQRAETLTRVKGCLRELAGQDIHVSILADGAAESPAAPVTPAPVNRRASLESMQKNEFVQQVTSIFGGTLVDVRPVASNSQQEA